MNERKTAKTFDDKKILRQIIANVNHRFSHVG